MRETGARVLAGLAALVGWVALVLQLVLLVGTFQSDGRSAVAAVWRFFGFFTILSNLAAACVMTHAALRPQARRGLGAPRAGLLVASAMAIVGIVYSIALRALWDPQGLSKVADTLLHDVAPVLVVLAFLVRPQHVAWRDAGAALVVPLVYCGYMFGRGALDGWYPYPFLDPNQLAMPQLAGNTVALAIAYGLVALVLAGAARLLRPRDKKS